VPVVAADNSSLPEVVGKAGLLVDARDADALADALCRLLSGASLRDWFVAAGHEQAQHFAWGRAARQLLALYEQLGVDTTQAATSRSHIRTGSP
jgi:glycosyltransferase involved in cell wall biosynthesis